MNELNSKKYASYKGCSRVNVDILNLTIEIIISYWMQNFVGDNGRTPQNSIVLGMELNGVKWYKSNSVRKVSR